MRINYTMIAHNLTYNHVVFQAKIDPQGLSRSETRPPGYPFFLSGIMSLTDSFDSFYSTTLFIQAMMGAMDCCSIIFFSEVSLACPMVFFCRYFGYVIAAHDNYQRLHPDRNRIHLFVASFIGYTSLLPPEPRHQPIMC